MVATGRSITVEVHALGEYAEPGAWCDHCLLPSAWTIPIHVVGRASLTTVARGALTACPECGHWHRDT